MSYGIVSAYLHIISLLIYTTFCSYGCTMALVVLHVNLNLLLHNKLHHESESSIACVAMCSLGMSPYPRELTMMS